MKSIFASSFLISLLLMVSLSCYGRKEPAAGDYWKSVMKDKPMPKAIKDLFHQADEGVKTDRFVKEFGLRSSAIIYHRRSETKKEQQQQQKENSDKTTELTVSEKSAQELKDRLNKLHN